MARPAYRPFVAALLLALAIGASAQRGRTRQRRSADMHIEAANATRVAAAAVGRRVRPALRAQPGPGGGLQGAGGD